MPFQDRCVTISRNKLIAVTLGLTGLGIAIGYTATHGHYGVLSVPLIGLAAMFRIRALLGALVECIDARVTRIEGEIRNAFALGRELGRDEGAAVSRLPR